MSALWSIAPAKYDADESLAIEVGARTPDWDFVPAEPEDRCNAQEDWRDEPEIEW